MPCNSDYMNPSTYERDISRVACLLDELNGEKWKNSWWDGYHPSVYSKITDELANELVSKLCDALQTRDVTKYSLEMQIWWRDHQFADKQRIEKELEIAKTESERSSALEKLTPHERKLLGL